MSEIKKEVLLQFVIDYDEVYCNKHPFSLITKGELYGVANLATGEIILEPVYRIYNFGFNDAHFTMTSKDGLSSIFSVETGKWLVPLIFQSVSYCIEKNGLLNEDLYGVELNDKQGVYSVSRNTLVVPAKYDHLFRLRGPYWAVEKYREMGGIFNSDSGTLILKIDGGDTGINFMSKDGVWSSDLCSVKSGKKTGIFSLKSERLVLPVEYEIRGDSIHKKIDKFWHITDGSKYGIFSEDTESLVVPVEYDLSYPISETLAYVYNKSNVCWKEAGLYSITQQRKLLPTEYENFKIFTDDLVRVQTMQENSQVYGVYSVKADAMIVPLRYPRVSYATDTLFIIKQYGEGHTVKEGIYDTETQTETWVS